MKNGWTGGQYSLVRVAIGTYLFVHFVGLVPWAAELFSNRGVLPIGSDSPLLHLFPNVLALWDGPAFVTTLVVAAAGLSVLFAIGFWDRAAAVLLWYIWACLHGRMPLISNPGLPYVGWLLLAHATLPPAPYGTWAARGRPDPDGGWRMPRVIFLVAWVLMAVGYSYSGFTKLVSPSWLDGSAIAHVLDNPLARPGAVRDLLLSLPPTVLSILTWSALALELGFAPLSLVPRLRPWLWASMLLMHLGLIVVLDFADLSLGMVMLHLFTFDPGWVPQPKAPTETLGYDGHCGLCHAAVRFLLAEDRSASAFRFAPLDSAAFRSALPEAVRAKLPDSFVVLTADGKVLIRSAAVRYVLRRLGRLWRLLGVAAAVVPARLLDLAYDTVARIRGRLFARPAEACPLLPLRLRDRFVAV
jgi:predicted DCC family thiol-disulfide oxidoreductase YuxK